MKPGFYWAKYKDYPVWQVYYYLEGRMYPCSPNRLASYIPVQDCDCITLIQEPDQLEGK